MGKTVESYRIALDKESQRWSGFARALRRQDRATFDSMMDTCRSYASAGSNATCPVMFEPMVLSILLHQQKMLSKIELQFLKAPESFESARFKQTYGHLNSLIVKKEGGFAGRYVSLAVILPLNRNPNTSRFNIL